MALTLATLTQVHSILTSERMSYKGTEIAGLFAVLNEVERELNRIQMERGQQNLQSRVVPQSAPSVPVEPGDTSKEK